MMKNLLCLMAFLTISNVALSADTPATLDGVKTVSAQEAFDLMSKGAKMIDVRVASDFAEERIKGAVLVPYVEKSKKEVKFDMSLDKFDDSKLPAENFVLYCNGWECWKSYKAAVWALSKGKKNFYRLRDGIPAWKAAKLPTEK